MLPLFYSDQLKEKDDSLVLDEETSRHIVQVLRMKRRERLQLTDGMGNAFIAVISDDHKKKVKVEIEKRDFQPQDNRKITIGISLLKNPNRFEWFLEKATEIGISEIIPLLCDRTERLHMRLDRMQNLIVSAMLQSRQYWMPKLHEPVPFKKIAEGASQQQRFIAHCIEVEKKNLTELVSNSTPSQIMLIGPEGDFTPEEIKIALEHQFVAVSLGDNRLRAETAGIVAAVLMKVTG